MTTRVTSPSTTARTAGRRPAGSPLPCPPPRARTWGELSPTIRAWPSPVRWPASPRRTVMREGSSTPLRPRRWMQASSCSRPCLPTPLPGRSRREAAMASRTRVAHRRRAGPPMKRTSRRVPRAPSTGRPPLATPSNGTRCAPSSMPIPPRRPSAPPFPSASVPPAWPRHGSASHGRHPAAASPAMPCTETVPPSGRQGPTARSSWTGMSRHPPPTRIRSTPSTSRTIIRRRRHPSRSPRRPCHPNSSREWQPRPPSAPRRRP